MSFNVSNSHQNIDPFYISGYDLKEPRQYQNIGQLITPYYGKNISQLGDYGPVQNKPYYTGYNNTYPYVLDRNFKPLGYIDSYSQNGTSCWCVDGKKRNNYFPCKPEFGYYRPSNYFQSNPNDNPYIKGAKYTSNISKYYKTTKINK